MSVTPVHARYAPLLKQMAEFYSDDPDVVAQLEALEILEEDWDVNHAGGHFKLKVPHSAPPIDLDIVEALAYDTDGMSICIILHTFGDRLNWGEWFRNDGEPILRWPPPFVRPAPRQN